MSDEMSFEDYAKWFEEKAGEDQIEQIRRLGSRVNYTAQSDARLNRLTIKDLRLTDEDLERLGYSKDGKLVTTVQLTRAKFFEEKDPPCENIDPTKIAWVKPYWYSDSHQPGIMILFNNGEFKAYTQNFEYFKHKVQQIVGNMVLVGGKLPELPWWGEV